MKFEKSKLEDTIVEKLAVMPASLMTEYAVRVLIRVVEEQQAKIDKLVAWHAACVGAEVKPGIHDQVEVRVAPGEDPAKFAARLRNAIAAELEAALKDSPKVPYSDHVKELVERVDVKVFPIDGPCTTMRNVAVGTVLPIDPAKVWRVEKADRVGGLFVARRGHAWERPERRPRDATFVVPCQSKPSGAKGLVEFAPGAVYQDPPAPKQVYSCSRCNVPSEYQDGPFTCTSCNSGF